MKTFRDFDMLGLWSWSGCWWFEQRVATVREKIVRAKVIRYMDMYLEWVKRGDGDACKRSLHVLLSRWHDQP